MLWDLTEGKLLSSLEAGDVINSLCFSPNKYWLCAAVGGSIKIWDLESKGVVDTLTPGMYITHPFFVYHQKLSVSYGPYSCYFR